MRTCGSGESLTGMRANVVPDMGTFGDDLGMDNLQMICSDGHMLDGLYGTSNTTTPNRKYKVRSINSLPSNTVIMSSENTFFNIIITEDYTTL